MSREECLVLLATAPVGRLGVSIDALPAVLPVNFTLLNSRIIIRTGVGSKLEAALRNAVVAFEVDSYDSWGTWGWSVLVRGRGSLVTALDELATLQLHPLRAWAYGAGQPGTYMAISIDMVSGRRFGQPTEWAAERWAPAPS